MVEDTAQTCKQCGMDYKENENFNWSCRTHRCDFSGEQWWCCGKTTKEALGCKFGKHVSRNDDDDDDIYVKRESGKNLRCKCCGEAGHLTNKCPKDPNLRTMIGNQSKVYEEEDRIMKLMAQKRFHANSIVQTTHFLKKCVIQQPQSSTEQLELVDMNDHPFKRGVMTFEDFNYAVFNPFILVQEGEKSNQIESKYEPLSEKQLQTIQKERNELGGNTANGELNE